jgi:hypothetical protein
MTGGPGRSEWRGGLPGGVLLSAKEEGEKDTPSGLRASGPWADFRAGLEVFPAAFFIFFYSFSFFFFYFSISLISFAKFTQFTSNQLLNSFKNQHNVLNQ